MRGYFGIAAAIALWGCASHGDVTIIEMRDHWRCDNGEFVQTRYLPSDDIGIEYNGQHYSLRKIDARMANHEWREQFGDGRVVLSTRVEQVSPFNTQGALTGVRGGPLRDCHVIDTESEERR